MECWPGNLTDIHFRQVKEAMEKGGYKTAGQKRDVKRARKAKEGLSVTDFPKDMGIFWPLSGRRFFVCSGDHIRSN
jgi:hypothetical protein